MKVLCLLPVLGQPRYWKRIDMLKASKFDITIGSFERDYFKGKAPDSDVLMLGKISHGNYLKRSIKMLSFIPKLRKLLIDKDIVYAFGTDLFFLCLLSSIGMRVKCVLEIGDIRPIQVDNGIRGRFYRLFEKIILKWCDLLVSTSEFFLINYYNDWQDITLNSIVIENKQDPIQIITDSNNQKESNKITIGYFGLLRCSWTWEILKSIAINHSERFEILIAGYSTLDINLHEEVILYESITYLGQYKSPDDLSRLYNLVDVVWACYPYPKKTDFNWKWARTNRFYESLYYGKPLIVLEDSGDSFLTKRYNFGFILPLKDVNLIVNHLISLKRSDLEEFKRNITKVPKEIYTYTNEVEFLKIKLQDLF